MCKPDVTVLPLAKTGPCGFSVRSYTNACAAFSLGWSWRARIANVLRRWADKAEGVQTITIAAYGPSQITFADVTDSVTVGLNGASKYLNDLWRERVFVDQGADAAPILPTKSVR